MKYSLRKRVAVALATLGLATCLVACGKDNDKAETVPQTEITQEIDSTIEEKTIPFKREDGSYLMLLVTKYRKTDKISYNSGYVTYDKNGVYFDNALTNIRVTISDESIFPSDSTEFYYLKLSSLCDEKYLLDGKISESIINSITSQYVEKDAYISSQGGHPTLAIYKNYEEYHTSINPLKLLKRVEYMKLENNNGIYTLDQTEPISVKDDTTYTDSDNVTIENQDEITSAKTLS